jgi:formate hydrogenlyase subunit 4
MMPFLTDCLLSFCQVVLVLLMAPLVNMLLKKWKANMQGRQGPPLLQGYYDLLKFFRKETVVSEQTSWLFLTAPLVVFATVSAACLLIPTVFGQSAFPSMGDMILFIFLLGLGRFFLVSAAMETGGGFCGMASSREMMFSTLIEPVMLLSLLVIALLSGSTNLFNMHNNLLSMGPLLYTPAYALALIALFIVSMAELGRVPFDNPETHYELTMIHEGMLLDYSGQPLGLMLWSAWSKQLLLLSLLANLLFPWGLVNPADTTVLPLAVGLYLLKLLVVCALVVLTETTIAKMRLFRVKDALGAAFIMATIALVFAAQQMHVNTPVQPKVAVAEAVGGGKP